MEKKKQTGKFARKPPPHKGEKYQQFRTGIKRDNKKLAEVESTANPANQVDKVTANKKKRSGKRAKVVLSFDEDDRRSFLTGFQKRKAERKQRAKFELESRVKEEMKRIKDKQQEKLKQLYQDVSVASILGEENAEYTVNYDLPDQSVSIMGVDIVNISGSLGLSMGVNKPKLVEDDDDKVDDKSKLDLDQSDDEDQTTNQKDPTSGKDLRSNIKQIKRTTSNALKNSKILKVKQRLNTKKALQRKRFGKGTKKSSGPVSEGPAGGAATTNKNLRNSKIR